MQPIEQALEQERGTNPRPIAAFDADGTLWSHDMGEGFFQYQVKQGYINANLGSVRDAWEHYRELKSSKNTETGLMWLAQVNRGFSIEQVRAWASEYLRSISPVRVFPEQQHLIQWLLQQNVQVYVVTASIKWSVEPGAGLFKIPFEQVLGFRTEIRDGIVTDIPEGQRTWREGKATGLLEATNNTKPFLSCGNSNGDEFLLRCSSNIRLAVRSHPKGHELFPQEEYLNDIARKNNWLHYEFQTDGD